MQVLPTGEQSFLKIRQNNLLYVDKTEYAYHLMASNPFCFLSRPRRFGKSLFLSMLKEIFLGKKHLFEGLYIYDKIDWQEYAVIFMDFSQIDFKSLGLENAIKRELKKNSDLYAISLVEESLGWQFRELIEKLHEKTGKQVVILIDEYDKPITEYLEDKQKASAQRDILKTFYSIIKGSSEHIRFFFLTGISRFSKVSIFSDLNNLTDLTFEPIYNNICGYTSEELYTYFDAHLELAAQQNKISMSEMKEKIKKWYNGYSWNGQERVYNPFSILRFFTSNAFRNYWFETGTPTFLIKLLRPDFRFNLENLQVSSAAFDNYNLENLEPITLLFQTGYLTIQNISRTELYTLVYPNQEVENSMLQYLLADYAKNIEKVSLYDAIIQSVEKHKLDLLIQSVNSLFSAIPSQIFIANKEAYYHSILYTCLKLASFYIDAEVNQAAGRLDAVLFYENRVYIFEFKLDESAEKALAQIHEKSYYLPYEHQGKEIYLVGINFSSEAKKVENWLVEKL